DQMNEGVENTPQDVQPLPGAGTTNLGDMAFGESALYVMQANRSLTVYPLIDVGDGEFRLSEPQSYLTLTFKRRHPVPAGISYEVEVSEDLVQWDTGLAVLESVTVFLEEDAALLTYRDTEPIGPVARRFMRLRVAEVD